MGIDAAQERLKCHSGGFYGLQQIYTPEFIKQCQAALSRAAAAASGDKTYAARVALHAEGLASAARARARGEADARLVTAKAEAKANLILRLSTSGSVLQYRALEKWNGKLPIMNGGGSLPMLTFDASKMAKGGDDDEKRLRELLGDEDDKPAAPAKDAEPKAEGDKPKADDKPAEKPPAKPAK